MRVVAPLLAFPIVLLLLGTAPGFAADSVQCAAPRELIEDEPQLPAISDRLKQHKPVTIVVIGGASTAGASPESAYPHFLESALRQRHPESAINVVNRGVSGQTTEQMAARFGKDVYTHQPALVIWEAGTVDAVQGEDVNDFADALTSGIAAVHQHKADIMLVDMQYNPSTVSVINFEPYLDALHQTAALEGVYMFQRFEIMKYWSEASVFDFNDVPKEKRASLAREFYECLGERLADAIDFAAR